MTVDTAPTAPAATPRPGPDDIEPVQPRDAGPHHHRHHHRGAVLRARPGVWQAWNSLLHWHDVAVFLILYLSTGFGITVGFHRLLHAPQLQDARRGSGRPWQPWARWRSRGTSFPGSPTIEAPRVLRRGGRPAQPPRGSRRRLARRAARALARPWGWLFEHTQRGKRERYAPDLLKDPDIAFIDRTFIWWAIGGIVVAFPLGMLLGGGSVEAGLTGLLWGGFIRILVLHHMTYSINSLCHFFGRRRFETEDHSRNLLWLSVPTLRRVVAQQPPRVPHVGIPRPALVGARPLCAGDPDDGEARPRLGRGPDRSGPPGSARRPAEAPGPDRPRAGPLQRGAAARRARGGAAHAARRVLCAQPRSRPPPDPDAFRLRVGGLVELELRAGPGRAARALSGARGRRDAAVRGQPACRPDGGARHPGRGRVGARRDRHGRLARGGR